MDLGQFQQFFKYLTVVESWHLTHQNAVILNEHETLVDSLIKLMPVQGS